MTCRSTGLTRRSALAASAMTFLPALSLAQAFPSRPLKIVVPFPAGGPTDVAARLVSVKMGEILGQPFVVENRAGATGMIGSAAVAAAPPDGYQMVMGTVGTHVQSPLLAAKPAYDARKDFTPVSLVATAPLLLVCSPSVKATSVTELVALMKAAPGRYSYASSGAGGPLHLAGALFERVTGTKALHVPYKGSAPALQAVMTGEVAFFFDVVSSSVPLVQAQRITGLAVTGSRRVGALPAVPTMAEAGFAQVDAYTWQALFAPARMPSDVLARLGQAAVAAVKDPEVAGKLSALGLDPVGSEPEALGKLVVDEFAKWSPIIEASGLRGTL